jgi:RNA polymerase sigma factor for flagellar operon FliA
MVLEQRLSRHPQIEEIAKELKVSTEMVTRVKQEVQAVSLLSLEESLSEDDDNTFSRQDVLADAKEVSPRNLYEFKEKQELVAGQIEKLPDNERLAITLYYYEEMNLKEIGVVLKISESRVCQLHTQAIDHIRRGIRKCSTSVYEE